MGWNDDYDDRRIHPKIPFSRYSGQGRCGVKDAMCIHVYMMICVYMMSLYRERQVGGSKPPTPAYPHDVEPMPKCGNTHPHSNGLKFVAIGS